MNTKKTTSKIRMRLVGAVATVALAGAVGISAVGTSSSPVLAEPVRLEQPVQAPSFADIVDAVSPAVVSVRVRGQLPETGQLSAPFFEMPGFENLPENHPLRRFFEQFEDPRSQQPQPRTPRPLAQGSGFFISEDGYLVTNNHVIEGGDDYTVVMDDGTEYQAELIGSDPRTDLAVLKVDEERQFTYVDFADDTNVRVGDWVVAVGNPFGLGGTVTAGIVSARGRDLGASVLNDFIQIDAAVNRGNSGGPAFNLAGEVVGVNTAIFSPSGGNVGIAFAIPSSLVSTVVQDLIEDGTVERGWLGVQIQEVTPQIAESVGLDEESGALIVNANDGEPAAEAGIQPGDIVLAVNGDAVDSPRDLARSVGALDPGETASLTVWRNGEETSIDVKLGTMPQDLSAAASPSSSTTDFGLTVTQAEDGGGLVVTDVQSGSPAEEAGVLPGDIIRSVNSQPVTSAEELSDAVDAASESGRGAVLVQIEREDTNRFIALPIS